MLAKFSAPDRPKFLFSRPELAARLGRWTEFPLTLIAAPAGYGKTTLASEAWRAWKGPKCWIALDEGDADPGRFLGTLARGLALSHPVLRERIGPDPSGPSSPDPEARLAALRASLESLPCQLMTVIDDCALLASPQVRRLAVRFLEGLPSHARFLLLTRDPGALPLSRWKLRQEVLEFGVQDLALSETEFEGWLDERLGARPEPGTLARLHRLFEGWLAGLQLLALRIEKEGDREAALDAVDADQPLLFDYLLEEVLRDLPAEGRRFLLETSILGHLQAGLCDEVRQAGNSAHLLQSMHQSQGFLVPLAGCGGYRYHRLFAEALQALLRRWNPAQLPVLHRRAARWHLVRGGLEASLEHALEAVDGDTLETLAARALENIFKNSGFAALQRHLRRLSGGLCAGRPWLSILCAWACIHAGREQEGETRIREAERILLLLDGSPDGDPGPAARARWTHLLLLKGMIARGDGDWGKAMERFRRAETLVPPEALFLRASLAAQSGVARFLGGDQPRAEVELTRAMSLSVKAGHHLAYFGSAYSLAELFGIQGRLAEAGHLLESCVRQAAALPDGGGPAAGYLRIALARRLRMLGHPAEAMREAEAGIAAGLAGGNIRILEYAHTAAALLLMEEGERDAAFGHLEQAESYGTRNRMHWAINLDDGRAIRIRCLGPGRERASADAWMARERSALAHPSWQGLDRCRTACALLEWRGGHAAAARMAGEWAVHAEASGWLWPALEFRRVAARAAGAAASPSVQAEHVRAAEALASAMGLGETGDEATSDAAGAGSQPRAAPGRGLSEREIEVLKAMREGKSNKEIAGSLFVAPSTVKTHLKSIFAKLDVNNRVRAVTRAVESGILR